MVRVFFGQPQYGWLPLTLQVDAFELILEVSDVPINPLEELCSSLKVVLTGEEASVWWHLEPTWYQFHIEPTSSGVVFTIWQCASYQRPNLKIFQYTGTVDTIVVPFYRALKHFASRPTSEKDWPSLDKENLQHLTDLVRARKGITSAE
jgi:hypothetical protein